MNYRHLYTAVPIAICSMSSLLFSQNPAQHPVDTAARRRAYEATHRATVDRRAAWIESQGLTARFQHIRKQVTPQFAAEQYPLYVRDSFTVNTIIDQRCQELAVLYDIPTIERLRTRGIDVVRAYLLGRDWQAVDFFDKSETIVVGQIVSAKTLTGIDDGYRSTAVIKVIEVLKGDSVGDTLLLRQESGQNDFARFVQAPGELLTASYGTVAIASGARYLLHISRKMYPLRVATKGKSTTGTTAFYIQTAVPIALEGERLLKGKGTVEWWEKMPATLSKIRDFGRRYR